MYLRILYRFCKHTGYNPDQLVALPPKEVNGLIKAFVGELGEQDCRKKMVTFSVKIFK